MLQKIFLLLLATLLLLGCQENQVGQVLSSAEKRAQEALGKLQSQQYDQKAAAEVEKLFIYEYRIVSLSSKLDEAQLASEMDKLGQDRWDCFNVLRQKKEYQVWCKRRPRTYLRYLEQLM